jgi:hypothetical protein
MAKPYVNLKVLTARGFMVEIKAKAPTPEMLKDAEALAHFMTYGERPDFKKVRPDLKPLKPTRKAKA